MEEEKRPAEEAAEAENTEQAGEREGAEAVAAESVESVAAESAQPSREQILATSREENKNGDERERQTFAKAGSLGFSAGLIICAVILIVTVIREDAFPSEIMLMMCSMEAVQSLVVAHGYRKMRKLYLIVGIVETICAVAFVIFWILQMCGVW